MSEKHKVLDNDCSIYVTLATEAWQQYNVLDMGYEGVPASALNSKQLISTHDIAIKQPGLMYIWLSYENESNNYVQFDDLKITHTKTNTVQYNEYNPFGLQTNNSWTKEGRSNSFLYNMGVG